MCSDVRRNPNVVWGNDLGAVRPIHLHPTQSPTTRTNAHGAMHVFRESTACLVSIVLFRVVRGCDHDASCASCTPMHDSDWPAHRLMHAARAREAAPNSLTPNGTKGVGVISPNMYTRTPRWMNTAAVHSCDMPSGHHATQGRTRKAQQTRTAKSFELCRPS